MESRNWKERIRAKQEISLEARGISMAKTEKQNRNRLEQVSQRGGVVAPKQDEDK